MQRLDAVDESFDHDAARTGGRTRVRIATLPSRFAEVDRTIERLDPKRFAWYATLGVGFLECGGSAAALTAARTELGSLILETRAEIDAWGPVGNSFPIMENLKLRFDPERRLNPGRFAGGL